MILQPNDSKAEGYSKHHQAYVMIKNLILTRRLSTAQKLIYRDLEEKIGMSKTPIINALMMLEKEGLVVSEKNRGFYVCEVNDDETAQILDLKERLEEIALELAVANHDKKDLQVLREKLNAYKRYSSVVYDQRRLLLDTEFHLHIASMSKNRFLLDIMRQFYEKIYFRLKISFLSPHIEKFKRDHDMLFEAIRKKRLNEAKRILRNHVRVGRLTQRVS